jgi:hypothetical protein
MDNPCNQVVVGMGMPHGESSGITCNIGLLDTPVKRGPNQEDTPPVPALHLRMWADGSEAALVLITSHVHPNDAPFEKGRRHKQYD